MHYLFCLAFTSIIFFSKKVCDSYQKYGTFGIPILHTQNITKTSVSICSTLWTSLLTTLKFDRVLKSLSPTGNEMLMLLSRRVNEYVVCLFLLGFFSFLFFLQNSFIYIPSIIPETIQEVYKRNCYTRMVLLSELKKKRIHLHCLFNWLILSILE